MAGKNIKGQLDMFELFGSVEELEENVKGTPEISSEDGVPEVEVPAENPGMGENVPEQSGRELPEPEAPGRPVMMRCFTERGRERTAVVAYLDYNRVYLQDWDREPVIYQFEGSKDAVDFYVDRMERYQNGKQIQIKKEAEALKMASVIKWTGEGEAE